MHSISEQPQVFGSLMFASKKPPKNWKQTQFELNGNLQRNGKAVRSPFQNFGGCAARSPFRSVPVRSEPALLESAVSSRPMI
jgi:hypothetical protein